MQGAAKASEARGSLIPHTDHPSSGSDRLLMLPSGR